MARPDGILEAVLGNVEAVTAAETVVARRILAG